MLELFAALSLNVLIIYNYFDDPTKLLYF